MGWFRNLLRTMDLDATSGPAPQEVRVLALPPDFPPFATVLKIPRGRREADKIYGDPSEEPRPEGRANAAWERANMVMAEQLPGTWNNGRPRLYVHKKMEPHLREALARAREARVIGELAQVGCFNFRHQRHDPDLPLSEHARGVAVDCNPKLNRAAYFVGRAPECWSELWRRTWPRGLSETLVKCFESCGFTWGGRWRSVDERGRTFVDPMHFQLVR